MERGIGEDCSEDTHEVTRQRNWAMPGLKPGTLGKACLGRGWSLTIILMGR